MAMVGALQLTTQALSQCSISSSCSTSTTSTVTPSLASAKLSSSSSASLWGSPHSMTKLSSTISSNGVVRKTPMAAVAMIFNEDIEETEEEITAAYEALYGKAFGASSPKKWETAVEDKDGEGDDAAGGKARGRGARGAASDSDRLGSGRRDERGARGARGDFEERVVQIRRVTKVVKGGKQLSFRAVVVVGDKKGKVGVGVNKAKEVITAVQKASLNAKRNLVTVPMTKYKTFPHRADGHYGAAHVMLRPASVGTGVIAGGAVRVVLELAGVENALGKQIGSENPLNNARAVVVAVSSMKTFAQVSADRGIPMEELWK
ncbi:unnamed protein product [Calypogeia fissa]